MAESGDQAGETTATLLAKLERHMQASDPTGFSSFLERRIADLELREERRIAELDLREENNKHTPNMANVTRLERRIADLDLREKNLEDALTAAAAEARLKGPQKEDENKGTSLWSVVDFPLSLVKTNHFTPQTAQGRSFLSLWSLSLLPFSSQWAATSSSKQKSQ